MQIPDKLHKGDTVVFYEEVDEYTEDYLHGVFSVTRDFDFRKFHDVFTELCGGFCGTKKLVEILGEYNIITAAKVINIVK